MSNLMNNILYIGLNGLAGSGKDTVAKMLRTILSKDWNDIEECREFYKKKYKDPTISSTYNSIDDKHSNVMCIAYADQLKEICSNIFGIPYERFYMNKSTAWVCINDQFQYTETKPNDEYIITAEDYYYSLDNYLYEKSKYWMSLREILVYVGTYVLQKGINKSTFVNIIRNKVRQEQFINKNLQYVIVTDIRFTHELDYIHENNGITITIERDGVSQLDNIAEHDLDEYDSYDYVIENSLGYGELFDTLWYIVHTDLEFSNITYELYNRDDTNNYLRLVKKTDDEYIFKLCSSHSIQQMYKSNGSITMIDPIGGPTICVDHPLETSKGVIIPREIIMNDVSNQFVISAEIQNG